MRPSPTYPEFLIMEKKALDFNTLDEALDYVGNLVADDWEVTTFTKDYADLDDPDSMFYFVVAVKDWNGD